MTTVDAHVHFWDPGALHYPWLADVPALERPFLPDDHRAVSDAARVLFVECNALPAERRLEIAFVERLAAHDARIVGIVAFADVAAAGPAALDGVRDVALVRGVRQNIQGHAPGYGLRPSFVEGVREAGRRGLAFDLCATHDQLAEVRTLVERCPDTRFVLDHCGKPAIGDGRFQPWADDVAALATMDHVSCKLSGLLTEAGPRPTFDAIAPYAEHVASCFGAERLMYASDWPVLTLAGTYADWLGIVDRVTSAWSADDRSAFHSGNAARVYGL